MNANKNIVREQELNWLEKQRRNINALKNTYYSSIYVVVCFIEQSIVLEFFKDLKLKMWIYTILGIISIVIMMWVCSKLISKARAKIEGKTCIVPNASNKIIECATMLGYLSPLLCISSFWGGFINEETNWMRCEIMCIKWGIIGFVLLIGIGMPLIIKKNNEK